MEDEIVRLAENHLEESNKIKNKINLFILVLKRILKGLLLQKEKKQQKRTPSNIKSNSSDISVGSIIFQQVSTSILIYITYLPIKINKNPLKKSLLK